VAAWTDFLKANLNPDLKSFRKAKPGLYTVIAQFIVDKEGNLSNIKALTNPGYGLEKEVIRVLNKSQKWLPAVQNGRKVKAYRKQPGTFKSST
jgi:protein TonB